MSIDLLAYARENRYRVRNLHDGHPAPPAKRPPRGKRGQDAFGADDDRLDAIVGQFGYIVVEGAGLGWYSGEFKARPPHGRMTAIRAAGGSVDQLGDFESAGTAPMSALLSLTRVIGVYRLLSEEAREERRERGQKQFERRGMRQMARARQ
jgi:hypothetical protein